MNHWEIVAVLLHGVSMNALLALIAGFIQRQGWLGARRALALGLAFGLAAMAAMAAPAVLPGFVIVDGRLAIVGLGAAYGGPAAGLLIAVMAGSYRYWSVGGLSAEAGTLSVLMAAALGLACGWAAKRLPEIRLPHMAAAGAILSLAVLSLLLRPWVDVREVFLQVFPLILVANITSAMVLGSLLKRETALLARERRLHRDAHSDPLTGLGNRRRLEAAFGALEGDAQAGALAILDIDHFKRINDTLGHAVGDDILAEFGRRLRSRSRASDLVIRQGGEEFVVLMPGATEAQASQVVDRILEAVRSEPFDGQMGRAVRSTASAGLAVYGGVRPEDLVEALERADALLYTAKNAGRNRVCRALPLAA